MKRLSILINFTRTANHSLSFTSLHTKENGLDIRIIWSFKKNGLKHPYLDLQQDQPAFSLLLVQAQDFGQHAGGMAIARSNLQDLGTRLDPGGVDHARGMFHLTVELGFRLHREVAVFVLRWTHQLKGGRLWSLTLWESQRFTLVPWKIREHLLGMEVLIGKTADQWSMFNSKLLN